MRSVKVRRVGNSRVITVPEDLGFTASEVLVQRLPSGQLLVTPADQLDAVALAQATASLGLRADILKLPNRRQPKP